MRYFNLKYCCVVGCLILAGALSMPSSGMATEALPEGAAPAATTLPAIVASPPSPTVALSVSAEQWSAPHSGEMIVTLPGLLAVMQQVVQQPDSGIALHYPEDERGEIWVEELRDWLVALGLSSNRIQLIPGSSGDVINISQVVVMQGSVDVKNTPPPVITEPFQIKEVTDAVNGVEIP